MAHPMHRSATAHRGRSAAVTETIHRAYVRGHHPHVLHARVPVHRANGPSALRNRARALEAGVATRNRAPAMSNCAVAVSNCALAVNALTMSIASMLRHFIRSMGAAHELALFETGIVGNPSPTLTRFES